MTFPLWPSEFNMYTSHSLGLVWGLHIWYGVALFLTVALLAIIAVEIALWLPQRRG